MILIKKIFYACTFFVFLSTLLCGQTNQKDLFTDSRDGKTYRTVKIGDQVWLAQNLNYTTEDGSWPVPGDSSGIQFGRFYTWEEAKNAVPAGWHLPSKQEFKRLTTNLGVTDLPDWDNLYPLLIKDGISGFNVQLTGSHNDGYGRQGKTASFWSSDEWWFSNLIPFFENPWRLSIRAPNYINIGHGAESSEGFNVRCLRDE